MKTGPPRTLPLNLDDLNPEWNDGVVKHLCVTLGGVWIALSKVENIRRQVQRKGKMLVLHVFLRHGRPCLQEQHQELEVVPLLRRLQQFQEEGVPLLLSLHVFDLDLGGKSV